MEEPAPNLNALWAECILGEIARQGVEHVVLSPGSRSAPLVRAAVRHPKIKPALWIDERGAAYHALGLARATGKPVVVLTTSGTAVANLLPAVVEADLDGVPLVVLTADRPPELHGVRANQTVGQTEFLRSNVRWQASLSCPDEALSLRYPLSVAAEAVARARGPHPGPVHVNVPFREPLAPDRLAPSQHRIEEARALLGPSVPFTRTRDLAAAPALGLEVEDLLATASGVIILCADVFAKRDDVLRALADIGWPVLCDIRSGLRLGTTRTESTSPVLLPGALALAAGRPAPQVVLQIGANPTAPQIEDVLAGSPSSRFLTLHSATGRVDPSRRAAFVLEGDPAATLGALAALRRGQPAAPRLEALARLEARVQTRLDEILAPETGHTTCPRVARWLSRALKPGEALFLSNSLPIRDLDRYAATDGPAACVSANRGASGIDGIVSTAAGFARGWKRRTVAVVGDQAFVHDLSALDGLRRNPAPLTLLILQNHGGGIFRLLPIGTHADLLTPWFDAAHDLSLAAGAAAFGLPARRVETFADLQSTLAEARTSDDPFIVEVAIPSGPDGEDRQAAERWLRDALDEAPAT